MKKLILVLLAVAALYSFSTIKDTVVCKVVNDTLYIPLDTRYIKLGDDVYKINHSMEKVEASQTKPHYFNPDFLYIDTMGAVPDDWVYPVFRQISIPDDVITTPGSTKMLDSSISFTYY